MFDASAGYAETRPAAERRAGWLDFAGVGR